MLSAMLSKLEKIVSRFLHAGATVALVSRSAMVVPLSFSKGGNGAMSGALPFPLPLAACVMGNEGASMVEIYSSSLGSDTGAAFRAKTWDRGMGVCGPTMREGCTRVAVDEESGGFLYTVDVEATEAVSAWYRDRESERYLEVSGMSVVCDEPVVPGSNALSSMAESSSRSSTFFAQPEACARELPRAKTLR